MPIMRVFLCLSSLGLILLGFFVSSSPLALVGLVTGTAMVFSRRRAPALASPLMGFGTPVLAG